MTHFNSILISLALTIQACAASAQATKNDTNTETVDSTVTIFSNQNYQLTLHLFSAGNDDEGKSNATLTFKHFVNGSSKTIFTDSLYCMYPWIQFKDFNNDGIKDILVFNTSGARSNWTHYLYLTDTQNHKLTFVKGFQELLNPELDTSTNIITSMALYGKIYYSFYRIGKNGKLVNLGHGFETEVDDPANKYEKAIKQLTKKTK